MTPPARYDPFQMIKLATIAMTPIAMVMSDPMLISPLPSKILGMASKKFTSRRTPPTIPKTKAMSANSCLLFIFHHVGLRQMFYSMEL
jgi:hypothetical protein